MTFTTADLYDQHEETLRVVAPGFRSYGGHSRVAGAAKTLRVFEDNSLVRKLLEQPGGGRVLVVDGGRSMRCALLGDNLARLGVENGWIGVVVQGCIRDSAEIRSMPLGVWALGTNPRKSIKRGRGEVEVEIELGGVALRPGDWLYADEDGIVIAEGPLPE
ncbi:MAG: ribonuclease E activity regulator RraA [bacterium]